MNTENDKVSKLEEDQLDNVQGGVFGGMLIMLGIYAIGAAAAATIGALTTKK